MRDAARFALRLASFVLITAALGARAEAQSPIEIVSPHPGEGVGSDGHYVVRWTAAAIPGNAGFVVYTVINGEQHTICRAAPEERLCDWSFPGDLPGPFSGTLFVEARNATGTPLVTAESGVFSIVGESLGDWERFDIGDVGRTGGARRLADGRIVVRGAGDDIWGTSDAFRFVFRDLEIPASGAFDATVTVAGVEGTEPWTKVGLMLREDLSPSSPHHFVFASLAKGLAYQRRLANGGLTLHTSISPSSTLPVTFEVYGRFGYTVIYAVRGETAQEVAAIPFANMRFVGMAVTSHDRAVLATGTFTDAEVDFVEPRVSIVFPEPEIVAGTPFTIQWTQDSAHPATVSFSVDGGQSWTVVPGCARVTATSCVWNDPGPATEAARIRVVLEDPTDRGAFNVTDPFAIRSGPVGGLPPAWMSGDVGAVAAAGSASFDASRGQFNVEGSGADIWDAADEFHFVSQTVVDLFGLGVEITARVVSVENVHRWTKAGLMVRAHRGADAVHASAFVTPTTEKGVAFQRRRTDGALSVHTAGPALTAPVWLKFIVSPGMVRAYYRQAATNDWTFLGEDHLDLSTFYEVGLAVSSHVDGRLARATFDNVTIVPRRLLNGNADIGAVSPPGATVTNDLERRLSGAGADIWGTADAFRYHFGRMGTTGVIRANVRSIQNTHPWAKAGVMIRADISPGSPHVMLIVSPERGIAMQYRAQPNGLSANVAIVPGAAPEWLRLRRQGARIVGEASNDALTWRLIGAVDLPLGDSVTAGLAVTSHRNGQLALGVFEDVVLLP